MDTPTSRLGSADVLVVDDTPANLGVLMGILDAARFRVRIATGGKRALAAVAAAPPDLVLLDISMPDMDGYEVCRRLKADPATAGIPIVFLSAHDAPLDKVKAFRAGGADYVAKPFEVEEVLARIEHQVSMRKLRDQLERRNQELEKANAELHAAHRATASVFSVLADVLPGSVLDGKYRLEAKIGAGGCGAVYRARHLPLDRDVAVKVLLPSARPQAPAASLRLRREGMSACRVQHPHAVAVLDLGVTESGVTYLVLELLRGHSLDVELSRGGPLSPRRCAGILAPVAAALAAAHAQGIVHRDVKPANIFLHQDERGEVVKVVDFGIARLTLPEGGEAATQLTGMGIAGTPPYMSPERIQEQDYDARADVFSVGVVLYQMLSGALPWDVPAEAGPLKVAFEIVHGAPVPLSRRLPGISPGLEALVMQSLARDPAARPGLSALAAGFADLAGDDPA